MRRGIGRLRAGGSGLSAAITALFAAGEQGAWYDPSDFSTQFQDSAGTTPVTATGQPVGKVLDKSGRGNHLIQATTASRPVLQQDGSGYYYWSFDGVDDRFVSAASVNLSGTSKVSVFAGVTKASTARGVLVSNVASAFTENGKFDVESNNTAGNYAFLANGATLGESYTDTSYGSPVSNVLSCVFDTTQATNATQIVPRVNGVTPTISSRVGTTGVGAFAAATIGLGAFTGGTSFFNGRMYQVILRGATSAAAEIAAAERYVGSKMGIAL